MKRLFNTKFKKAVLIILCTILVLCVAFIRTVPNYSKDKGYEIVSLWDYNKYNQGYCLAENRILDKEELYKRAIGEYLEKKILSWKGAKTELNENYEYNYNIEQIGCYLVDTFDSSNWYEFLTKNYEYGKTYKEISNAKKIDNPMDYIVFDFNSTLNKDFVGFSKPIFILGNLYLDKSFIVVDKGFILLNFISVTNKPTEYDRDLYYHDIKNLRPEEYSKKVFDNCGNTNINVEQNIKDITFAILHGG